MSAIRTVPGGPGTFTGASGGKIYGYNNISESANVQVAAANPSRQSITFHNPGSADVFVSQTTIQTSGSDVAFTPTNAALGGTIRVYGNGGQFTITGECQKAWQAFSLTGSGSTNPLTVIETNV